MSTICAARRGGVGRGTLSLVRPAIPLLTLSLLACDPKAGSPSDASKHDAPTQPREQPPEPDEAEPAAKPAEPAPSPTDAAVEQLSADVSQSKIGFVVSRAPIGHVGHFERFEATLELREGQPSALQIRVIAESVVADRLGLTEHLKSADFFDVATYPSASFGTTSLTPLVPSSKADSDDAETADNIRVVGFMMLHGVERELAFPARFDIDAERAIARATLDISAKAFGIDYAGMEDELAEDAVGLEVELWFPRARE